MEPALIHGWVTTLSDEYLNVTAPLQKNKAANTRWSAHVYRGRASNKRAAASYIQAQRFSRIHLLVHYLCTFIKVKGHLTSEKP